jgi:uncharacterized membrane protein YgaE (UPF0421/DUF939 family)
MTNNRALAAAFGVINSGTFLLYHTAGIFLPPNNFPEVIWSGFIVYLLVMIFTPALMVKARWTALGAMLVGVIVLTRPILRITAGFWDRLTLFFGGWAATILLLLALPFIYFSFRAYQEK